MDVEEFKSICIEFEPDEIVQRCLIDGSIYFFERIIPGQEYTFKKDICRILNTHIRQIVIVGSGKLGFSIKPDETIPEKGLYLFKKFDSAYEADNNEKKSDLDVGIVSSDLFDREMENIFKYTGSYKTFVGKARNDFGQYMLKGRFIVSYLPSEFPLTKDIEFVQSYYKMQFGRDVNLEIYKSWNYFEAYHQNNVRKIKLNLLKE